MSIDRAGPAGALLAALAGELRRSGRAVRENGTSAARQPAARPSDPSPGAVPEASLREMALQAVKDVDTRDPDAVRAARRRLIRSVLLSRLGAQIREHPQWQAMVESIEATLERDARHGEQFLELIDRLRKEGGVPP